jgi:hypothetical protein
MRLNVMLRVNFSPKDQGFHFRNSFVNNIVNLPWAGPIETRGRCGGMAYASLDYYHAGLPIPRYTSEDFSNSAGVPADGHWLSDYIYSRLINSFLVPSAAKFVQWTLHADHSTWFYKGVTKWTKEEEFPKLRAIIDGGNPVVLGLISIDAHSIGEVGNNHQVVAFGYDFDENTGLMRVYIYDNNYRDVEVTLESLPNNPHFNASTGDIWRGFFIQDYSPARPPIEAWQSFFPSVHDYAVREGYVGGIPNFYSAAYGGGTVYGCVLLKPQYAEWRDIPFADLNSPPTPEARFREVNDYSKSLNSIIGGYPNFHQFDYGQGLVCGSVFLKDGAAEWRDLLATELGNPQTAEDRFRAVHDYASRNGFAGAFPNFHQADYGQGIVYGTFLLKPEAVEWRDVPYSQL